jgi:transcriptional regulator GlxA family with amidase domain
MHIVFLLFDAVTPLDAVGPIEVFGRLPGAVLTMAGKQRGEVRTRGGSLGLTVDRSLDEVDEVDILVVPGGAGADIAAEDPAITGWVASVHPGTTWTMSVCTGALVLGAAGLLQGREAVTHWRAMDLLPLYGAAPVSRRWVRSGKVVSTQGVSAGIDMALALAAEIAGEEVAKAIQLGLEYAPQPPFDAGRIEEAPAARVEMVRSALSRP